MRNLVLAITGASGSIYALRLLEVLLAAGRTVHLTISPAAQLVLDRELAITVDLNDFRLSQLLPDDRELAQDSALRMLRTSPQNSPGDGSSVLTSEARESVFSHHYQDFNAGIASGSFLTDGMVICPCSMGSLASIAHGMSDNLIHRAADVHLKERRKLIVVPRETPLGSIQLDNMKRLADAGAIVMPASPGFYHNPVTIQQLVDFVVGRILDHLDIEHTLVRRWGGPAM